jgi:hypothetical protein
MLHHSRTLHIGLYVKQPSGAHLGEKQTKLFVLCRIQQKLQEAVQQLGLMQ